MLKLTLNILDNCMPLIILATGKAIDNPDGLHLTGSGRKLRWVLKIGQVGDWAVYCHWAEYSKSYVRDHGDKIMNKKNLQNIIDFDDGVWSRYRF